MNSVRSNFDNSSRRLSLLLALCVAGAQAMAAEAAAPAASAPAAVQSESTPAPVANSAAAPARAATPQPKAAPAAAGPAAQPRAATATPAAAAASKPATAAAQPVTIDSFRLITERNIFNPNRIGRTVRNSEPAAPVQKVDTISLVGTMESEQGLRAFFDSSNAALPKAARAGDSVGEFAVQKISSDGVVLVRDGKEIPLRVTQQLRRPEGGEWTVTGIVASAAPARAVTAENDPATPPSIPADASDVLRRLMEQRQKQLKQ